MGGCLSKKDLPAHTKKKKKGRWAKEKHLKRDSPPLPPSSPPEDEAVVKEVLTETPTSCVVAAVSNSRRAEDDKVVKPDRKVDAAARPASFNGCRYGLKGVSEEGGEEEVSELYSASESFSVSTTLTEKKDAGADDLEEEASSFCKGPPKRRPPERSPAGKSYQQRKCSSSGEFPPKRDPKRGVGGGAGRSSPSPAKRPTNGRTFPGRDAAYTARQRAGNGIAAPAGAARTDRGERSGRGRSASPAAKRAAAGGGSGRGGGAGRSSPMRRMAGPGHASPERTPRREEDDCRQMMRTMMKGRGGAEAEEEGTAAMPPAPVPEEMLENPLVTLECFIFL